LKDENLKMYQFKYNYRHERNRGGILISSYPYFYFNVWHTTRSRMVPAQNYETLKKSERRSTSFLKAKIDIYQFTYNYNNQKNRGGF